MKEGCKMTTKSLVCFRCGAEFNHIEYYAGKPQLSNATDLKLIHICPKCNGKLGRSKSSNPIMVKYNLTNKVSLLSAVLSLLLWILFIYSGSYIGIFKLNPFLNYGDNLNSIFLTTIIGIMFIVIVGFLSPLMAIYAFKIRNQLYIKEIDKISDDKTFYIEISELKLFLVYFNMLLLSFVILFKEIIGGNLLLNLIFGAIFCVIVGLINYKIINKLSK